MPTIEQSNQPEDQTKDEKSSPSSDESGSSATEAIQTKQSGKVAVKKKTVRKKAARKKTAQTAGRQIQDEQSNNSATETKQTTQPEKVAVKKKTVRKKAAKKKTAQTTSAQIQDEQYNSGATETKQTTQPEKVAVKKKTVRKKAAKKKTAQTELKQIQLEPASESDKAAASLVVNAAGKTAPVGNAAPPAAAPSRPQPQPQGATGLMGFWIKVGISAFVIVVGIITVFSFFGEDETTSGPEATQATAGAQGENASVADDIAADRRTAPGVAFPPTPEQSSVLDRSSSQRYGNQLGAFAGAAVANTPAMESAANAAVTHPVPPGAGQPPASQPYVAPPPPRGNSFYHQPAEYRPELYRPLEPEQDSSAPTQSGSGSANETPRTTVVPAPTYYPQPGTYAYPPAPQYGGYGGYYPY